MNATFDDLQMGVANILDNLSEFFFWNTGLDAQGQYAGSARAKLPFFPGVTAS